MSAPTLFAFSRALVILALLALCTVARGQGAPEHTLILEIGGAAEKSLRGGGPSYGGTVAAEVEPIENWLELELGISALATARHSELSGDLLFKKPFRFSETFEFMVGAGPSVSRSLGGPDRGTSRAAEFVVDFMFWPQRRLGWFVEPSWTIVPKNGEQVLGVTAGLLIGF